MAKPRLYQKNTKISWAWWHVPVMQLLRRFKWFSSLSLPSYWDYRGNTPETRGTAYVVYEDIFDAKNACDHLSGFNVCNRYLVVLYYNANRAFQKMDTKKKEEQLKLLKEKYGINTDPPK
uniref:Splicing factor 3b subunit 6 n=1 Tax=Macaca fascicularis TaxID=9541 RepID=G7PLR0_MACFA